MSLRVILLGLLDAPATGYELGKAFEQTVRHFWHAELSQIYPTLYRLRDEGRVDVSTEPSSRGPARKVYTRTPAGTEELHRWVSGGPIVETGKHRWLGQLFFMGEVCDAEETRAFVRRLREMFSERLQLLRAIDAAHRQGRQRPQGLTLETVHPYLTLRCGIRRMAATVDWCDESLALLDELEQGA